MPPQTLIEVIDPEKDGKDVPALKGAITSRHAFGLLEGIIHRLPRPRVYVCESFANNNDDSPNWLWAEGREVLTAQLIQEGVSIIDPGTIRAIGKLCKKLEIKDPNPLVWAILQAELINGIYLPEDGRGKRHDQFREIANQLGITVHLYRPEVIPVMAYRKRSRPSSTPLT